MASRRLAMSLNQGLRAQRAIRSVKPKMQMGLTRSLATPVSHGSTTESTTLSNGFTVRSHWPAEAMRWIGQLTGDGIDCNRTLSLRPDEHGRRVD